MAMLSFFWELAQGLATVFAIASVYVLAAVIHDYLERRAAYGPREG